MEIKRKQLTQVTTSINLTDIWKHEAKNISSENLCQKYLKYHLELILI